MRISDWSSDVCSSDLRGPPRQGGAQARSDPGRVDRPCPFGGSRCQAELAHAPADVRRAAVVAGRRRRLLAAERRIGVDRQCLRSEEHTSELQSLMRISYAVFCLKKKTEEPQQQYSQI